jgi:general secretion pathway protein G
MCPSSISFLKMKKIKKNGFTLIELLVVISVIGLLAALIMVNFNAARERARDVQRKSDLDQTKKALRMYYNDDSAYPLDDGEGRIMGCGNPPSETFEWGQEPFACGEMVYMKLLPQNPTWKEAGDPSYSYTRDASGQDFCLSTALENKSDSDINDSQERCASVCGAFDEDGGIYAVCAD